MESRSVAAIFSGFLFWFLMAGFIYYRNQGWAMALGAVTIAAVLIWGGLRRLRQNRPKRPESPPPSNLPDYDFKDTKPSDFE